jgi:peptidoglycan/xylan/chitin deacetylase (PgdA/CDA1 family)
VRRREFLSTLGAVALSSAALPAKAAASNSDRMVALTFDDGPHPVLTPRLLDMLQQEGVNATFYVVGSCASRCPDIVRRAYEYGNEIGNHSWSHPFLTRISLDRAAEEISRTDALLQSITGAVPNTVRPPYGAMSDSIRALAMPRPMMLWNVDTNDWRSRNSASVERAAGTRGGIVLMHDIHSTTIEAVPTIIRDFKLRGFRFVTISGYVEQNARNEAWFHQP